MNYNANTTGNDVETLEPETATADHENNSINGETNADVNDDAGNSVERAGDENRGEDERQGEEGGEGDANETNETPDYHGEPEIDTPGTPHEPNEPALPESAAQD